MINEKSKVLVIGNQGMLGSDIEKTFCLFLPKDQVFGCDRETLDITSPKSIQNTILSFKPHIVINCAAYTQVDLAETEKEKAFAINTLGVHNLRQACTPRDIFIVHFSTDQVFDGKKGSPYKEEDPINPLNFYAYTKYLGEEMLASYAQHLIFRVQWLYGEKKDRFTTLKEKTSFSPFSDQVGAPNWTKNVAALTATSLQKKLEGLYHLSADNSATWAEVFEFAKNKLKLPLKLTPKKTDELKLPAARPLYSFLSNQKLCKALGVDNLGSWEESLSSFLKTV